MGMFDGMRRRTIPQMPMEMVAPSYYQPAQEQRGRGLFSGLRRTFTPDRLEAIGAIINDAQRGTNNFPQLMQNRQTDALNRDMFNMRARSAKIEEGQAQQQQQAIEQYITSLPPEQQAQARMAAAVDPAAFAEAIAQQMTGGGWQVGQGYSHAFRIRPDGTRETGDPLPLRPRAPVVGYMSPGDAMDWEYSDD